MISAAWTSALYFLGFGIWKRIAMKEASHIVVKSGSKGSSKLLCNCHQCMVQLLEAADSRHQLT